MTAIDDWIAELNASRYSEGSQNLESKVATAVAALAAIIAGLTPAGSEAANTFYAGPGAGVPALPSFRALVLADIAAALASGDITLGAAVNLTFNGRSKINSPADGLLTLLNNAGTDFTRLNFGGVTAAFPALKRTGAALQAMLADASGDANIICSQLQPNQTAGILATTTANNANAGSIGEFFNKTVTAAAPVAVGASATPQDLTSQALSAGDWEVSGQITTNPTVATTGQIAGFNTVQDTMPAVELQTNGPPQGSRYSVVVPPQRVLLAAPATIHLVGNIFFAGGTVSIYGFLNCRRMR